MGQRVSTERWSLPSNIGNFVTMRHENKAGSPYRRFMPPMAGTQQDIDDVTNLLNAQVNPPVQGVKKQLLTAQK